MGELNLFEKILRWAKYKIAPLICMYKNHVMISSEVFTAENQDVALEGCYCDRCGHTWVFKTYEAVSE